MKLTTRDLVLCAFCAAVTCILAPISVPLAGEVPISLATFAVLLSGILLGGRLGAMSQLIYVERSASSFMSFSAASEYLYSQAGPAGSVSRSA